MLEVCFSESTIIHVRDLPFRAPILANRAQVETPNAGMRDPPDCVRIVMPSEWANIGVACFNFYSNVYEHPQRNDK